MGGEDTMSLVERTLWLTVRLSDRREVPDQEQFRSEILDYVDGLFSNLDPASVCVLKCENPYLDVEEVDDHLWHALADGPGLRKSGIVEARPSG